MKLIALLMASAISLNAYTQEINKVSGPLKYVYDSSKEYDLEAFVFMPDELNPSAGYPAIVIFHGGGWSIGEPSWAFGIAKKYASKGMVAIAAQYSLSDQKSITPLDAMEDARNVIIWIRENSTELRIDKNKIAAYGWSAGAHLAACAAVFSSSSGDTSINSIPNALLLVSPALSIINDNWFKQLLKNESESYDCSPAENLRENMPPSIIVVGRDDSVTPLYESNLFHQNMLKYGNESYLFVYDNVGHLFTPSDQPDDGYPNPDKAIQAKAYNELDNFLRELKYMK
ncbi:MAG: alpha/beta hydrolase [Bacteroidota bacterium]